MKIKILHKALFIVCLLNSNFLITSENGIANDEWDGEFNPKNVILARIDDVGRSRASAKSPTIQKPADPTLIKNINAKIDAIDALKTKALFGDMKSVFCPGLNPFYNHEDSSDDENDDDDSELNKAVTTFHLGFYTETMSLNGHSKNDYTDYDDDNDEQIEKCCKTIFTTQSSKKQDVALIHIIRRLNLQGRTPHFNTHLKNFLTAAHEYDEQYLLDFEQTLAGIITKINSDFEQRKTAHDKNMIKHNSLKIKYAKAKSDARKETMAAIEKLTQTVNRQAVAVEKLLAANNSTLAVKTSPTTLE